MIFSEKLVFLRKGKHLTQDALAKTVGVSRQAVYMWEKGISYPEAQKLLELRLLFNVSIDSLLMDDSDLVFIDPNEVSNLNNKISVTLSDAGNDNNVDDSDKIEEREHSEQITLSSPNHELDAVSDVVMPEEPTSTSLQDEKASPISNPELAVLQNPVAKESGKVAPKMKIEPESSKKTKTGGIFDFVGVLFRKKH